MFGTAVQFFSQFVRGPCGAPELLSRLVTRPTRFEHNQYVGDKRSRFVHDLDATTDECAIDDLMASEQFQAFGPDSLAEARNRGFRPHPPCTGEARGGAPAVASETGPSSDSDT
jgi:hypothetical protein